MVNPAYQKYPELVKMDLSLGYQMANNSFLRNIVVYRQRARNLLRSPTAAGQNKVGLQPDPAF
jgi:hypothetical protein